MIISLKNKPLLWRGVKNTENCDYSTGVSLSSLSEPCFLLINLSTEPIAKEPNTKIRNELKINSLTTNGLPKNPVTISAPANKHIIKNAINPTTDFSLIELLSQNN
jgi:hypothetical protein